MEFIMKLKQLIDRIKVYLQRRGGRVAEGAPLLRKATSEFKIKATILATYLAATDTFVKLKTRLDFSPIFQRKSTDADWHTVEDIYDTLVQVLDCKTRYLNKPLPDELGEVRETLVEMQLAHRGARSEINSDSVGV